MAETDTNPTVPTARGPVLRTERALAPDLARGAMLLFIALANAANFAFAGQPGIDPTPHGLERGWNLLMLTLVDSRAYPVFAVMFGYGLVQIARRQEAAGNDPRRVLLRRNGWLLVFGLVHATLLYFGDFLGAYGIIGILATLLLLRRGDRFNRLVLWLWAIQLGYVLVLAAMVAARVAGGSGTDAALTNSPNPSLEADTFLGAMSDRLAEWPVHTATVVPMIVIVWLGMWAARRRLLEDPAQHRVLLRRVAIGGLAITVAGGLPYALVGAGLIHVDASAVDAMALLHAVSGEYGGPGYVALFGLLAIRLSHRTRAGAGASVVSAVSALGQRSLSGYLFQSIAWTVLLAPWALALGEHGSTAFVAAAAAVGVWLASVLAARAMDRRGYRGPAELLLRRLTYGSKSLCTEQTKGRRLPA